MDSKYIHSGILRAILYADIFQYPLTAHEVCRFFIGNTPVSKVVVQKEIKNIPSLAFSDGYYALKEKKHNIRKRIDSEKISTQKYVIAKKICFLLSHIPTILLIGISGGLAMNNVQQDDDIDLFVITKNNMLWTTRLVTLLILRIMGVQRRKKSLHVSNKICLNMMVTVSGMAIPNKKRNLFTAHEVAQMKPLFIRGDIYKRFLLANRWIYTFLPNVIPAEAGIQKYIHIDSHLSPKGTSFFEAAHGNDKVNMFEFVAKKLQLWYMRSHVTTEVVSDTILAFHPKDYTETVLKKYNERVKRYKKI